jgi:hypothetical protein
VKALRVTSQPGALAFTSLVATVAGQDELAAQLEALQAPCARTLQQSFRRGDLAFPVLADTACVAPEPARELALGQLLLSAGRDREAVVHLRCFRSQAFSGEAWEAWALPWARVNEATALLRLGDRKAARALLAPMEREFSRADPDLPWVSQLRALQVQH